MTENLGKKERESLDWFLKDWLLSEDELVTLQKLKEQKRIDDNRIADYINQTPIFNENKALSEKFPTDFIKEFQVLIWIENPSWVFDTKTFFEMLVMWQEFPWVDYYIIKDNDPKLPANTLFSVIDKLSWKNSSIRRAVLDSGFDKIKIGDMITLGDDNILIYRDRKLIKEIDISFMKGQSVVKNLKPKDSWWVEHDNDTPETRLKPSQAYEDLLAVKDPKERFEMVTEPVNMWYFKINFNKMLKYAPYTAEQLSLLARTLTLNDILPPDKMSCIIMKNIRWVDAVKPNNYFDVVFRWTDWSFSKNWSIKRGINNPYKFPIISNWYIIKPFNIKEQDLVDAQIFSSNSKNKLWAGEVEAFGKNEQIIRTFYWDEIVSIASRNIDVNPTTVIDVDLLYAMMARESKFNPNAISRTQVRGLGQVQQNVIAEMLYDNSVAIRKWLWKADHLFDVSDILNIWNPLKYNRVKNKATGWYEYRLAWIDSKLYLPETWIRAMSNNLMNMEEDLSNILPNWDSYTELFKRQIILASYNWWSIIQYTLLTHPNIRERSALSNQLGKYYSKWIATLQSPNWSERSFNLEWEKLVEIRWYVTSTIWYYNLASS